MRKLPVFMFSITILPVLIEPVATGLRDDCLPRTKAAPRNFPFHLINKLIAFLLSIKSISKSFF